MVQKVQNFHLPTFYRFALQFLNKQCHQNTWKIWQFCNLGSWDFQPEFWKFVQFNLTSKFRSTFGSTLALLFRCETTRKSDFSKHLVKNYHANCPHDWRISAMQWEEQLSRGRGRPGTPSSLQTTYCPVPDLKSLKCP